MIREKRKQRILQQLKEIAPKWAHQIPSGLYASVYKGKQLDIGLCDKCIVGEAHGFKNNYAHQDTPGYCKECYRFCGDVTDDITDNYNWGQLDDFIKHFKRCHK